MSFRDNKPKFDDMQDDYMDNENPFDKYDKDYQDGEPSSKLGKLFSPVKKLHHTRKQKKMLKLRDKYESDKDSLDPQDFHMKYDNTKPAKIAFFVIVIVAVGFILLKAL